MMFARTANTTAIVGPHEEISTTEFETKKQDQILNESNANNVKTRVSATVLKR